MKYVISLVFFFFLLCIGCSEGKKSVEDKFSIEILDDQALELIDPKAQIKLIGSGFTWTEGPLWIEEGKYLLFSDIPNNSVFKLDGQHKLSKYLDPSGYTGDLPREGEMGSNGLLLDESGHLVLLQHGDRRVARMRGSLQNPAPEFETLIGEYQGKRFNSPNDATFDKAGNLYFTDPPYGLSDGMEDASKELDFQGIYCLKATGELVLVDTLTRPNGIAISNDGKHLFVAVSDPKQAVWFKYDIHAPGEVDNKELFYDTTHLVGKEGQQGLPDGMKMHSKGFLFATGPGGVWVFNKNGEAIARIHTGQATSNCAFNTDESVLFMTADDYVLLVGLK